MHTYSVLGKKLAFDPQIQNRGLMNNRSQGALLKVNCLNIHSEYVNLCYT
jgi:hypothetical protein